jgi:uncharacterized protein
MTIQHAELLRNTFPQMLANMSGWMDKAAGHLDRLGLDHDLMLSWQLAPDMYPLAGQVRFACFLACEPRLRLQNLGLPAPLLSIRDQGWSSYEQPGTLSQAMALLAETIASFDEDDLPRIAVAADRSISLELPDGHVFDLKASEYVHNWAVPQFYFHVNTAYAILRANGVGLGKKDYAAHMFRYLRQRRAD